MSDVKLKIDPEFFAYLPRPNAEAHAKFEAVLLEEGIRDPIIVWKDHDGIIVDGMTRFQIAEKHKLPFTTVEKHFENRKDVKLWMSRNQATRRNLTEQQHNYHLGVVYNREKGTHGGARRGKEESQESTGSAAETVGVDFGVNAKKVVNAGKFAELVDAASERLPEVREAINAGKRLSAAVLKKIIDADTKPEARAIFKKATDDKPKPSDEPAEVEEPEVPEDPEVPEIKVYDGLGKLVTDVRYHVVFSDATTFDKLLREARALRTKIKSLTESGGGVNIHFESDGPLAAAFKLIEAELKNKKPVVICKKCKGEKVIEKDGKTIECDGPCMSNGFVDHYHHNRK